MITFSEYINEGKVNRKVDGENLKFDSKHLKDIREIIDTVGSSKNNIKLISQMGDWEVSFDITDDETTYANIVKSYNLDNFDIETNKNIVTIKAKAI